MSSNMRLVQGVGINDMPEHRTVDCPIHSAWRNMLRRCYDPKQQIKQPTYIGCTVAPEWHHFSAFHEWMTRQPWQGRQIDKDILFPGNKVYSPEACVFVTKPTNLLLCDSRAIRGEWPLGVAFHKRINLFIAQIKRNGTRVGLGRFSNPMDAHAAWQREKAKQIRECAATQDDWRVMHALEMRAEQLDNDRLHNQETVKL